MNRDGKITIEGTDGDDTIEIKYHCDGSASVCVNGEEFEVTAEQASNLEIEAGEGDDTIGSTRNGWFRSRDSVVNQF